MIPSKSYMRLKINNYIKAYAAVGVGVGLGHTSINGME